MKENWVWRRSRRSIVAGFTFRLIEEDSACVPVDCSSVDRAGRGARDQLHRGESPIPLHGGPDCSWVCRFHGDVAEKEAQGEAEPAGEGLCGSGQTPKCGEELIYGIFTLDLCQLNEKLLKCSLFLQLSQSLRWFQLVSV